MQICKGTIFFLHIKEDEKIYILFKKKHTFTSKLFPYETNMCENAPSVYNLSCEFHITYLLKLFPHENTFDPSPRVSSWLFGVYFRRTICAYRHFVAIKQL